MYPSGTSVLVGHPLQTMPSTIVSRPFATLTVVTMVLGCIAAVAQSPFTVAANAPLPVDLTRDIVSEAQKRAGSMAESAGPWGVLE